MIYDVKAYAAKCDNCGCEAFDNTEYSCWPDPSQVQEELDNMGWSTETIQDETALCLQYCDLCHSYNDNDELVLNETRKNIFNATHN